MFIIYSLKKQRERMLLLISPSYFKCDKAAFFIILKIAINSISTNKSWISSGISQI